MADATIDSVSVFFASVTANDPNYPITLSLNAVAENGEPGEVLATASVKAGDLQYSDNDYLATKFVLDKTVNLKAGEEFFVVAGPFPNTTLEVSPYTSDDISIFCLRRDKDKKTTAWQHVEDQDANGNGLGTYKWFKNTDDPTSIAITPCVEYKTTSGINQTNATTDQAAKVDALYTMDGMKVTTPCSGRIYIVKYSDGTCRKVLWK